MTIASAITAAQGKVADCYTAISNKGGTLPATQNLSNMPTAIGSIPTGGGGGTATLTIAKGMTESATYFSSQILVNDDLIYYNSGDFTSFNTTSVTVPKGLVTITCVAYLGNYVGFNLSNVDPEHMGDPDEWYVFPFHENPGDVAIISKTIDITSDTTVYLYATQ